MEKWNCENCNFQTYSILLFYKHNCKPWELKVETEAEDSSTTPFDCANILQLYKCTNCDFYTNLKILLQRHVKEVHNDQALCDSSIATASQKSYSCKKCNFQTCCVLVLYKHVCTLVRSIRTKKTTKWFRCGHCKFKSKWEESVKRHWITHSEKWFYCEHCEFKTKRKGALTFHLKNKHGIRTCFKCTHCESQFVNKLYLKNHIEKQHAVNRKWDHCKHCDFKTKSVDILKTHLRVVHALELYFKCGHCQSKFKHRWRLKIHIKQQHFMSKETWYQCDYCEYTTKDLSYIRRHLIVQHSNNHKTDTLQCDRYDYKTELKSSLELEHSVNCMFCEQIFMLTSQLKKHVMEQHSIVDKKAKPFHCQHCNYKARFVYLLEKHMFTKHKDHQIRGYKCEQCEIPFKLKTDLERHSSRAEAPLQCDVYYRKIKWFTCKHCGNKFLSERDLVRHILQVHSNGVEIVLQCDTYYEKINWFKCEHCEKKFLLETDLEIHVLEVHSNKAEKLEHRDQREDEIPYSLILKEHDYSIQPFSYISSPTSLNDVTDILQGFQETGNKESTCIKPTVKL